MKKLYIWPGLVNEQIVKDLLKDFEVDMISESKINNSYVKNKNILVFIFTMTPKPGGLDK